MTQILIIESSPRGAQSASRQLTKRLRGRLKAQYPEAKVIDRDLAKESIPHLDYPTVKAIFTKDRAEAESLKEVLRLSDQLIKEVLSSDLSVIASLMWNFGLPSALNAWIDHIVALGRRSAIRQMESRGWLLARRRSWYLPPVESSLMDPGNHGISRSLIFA